MAITLADFNKIWASTSPLTPYSFSESNYKQGWNFIGSTPPARQMWDYLQKNNDEKMQYLANNYLPLSGGTITGDAFAPTPTAGDDSTKIATTEFVANDLKANTMLLADTFATTIPNGADLNDYTTAGTYRTTGASVTNTLVNCPATGYAIKLVVQCVGYNSNDYGMQMIYSAEQIIFVRSRTATSWTEWKRVAYAEDVLPLSGGTMTGAITRNSVAIKGSVNTSYVEIEGGTSDQDGAYITLYGGNRSSYAGRFVLSAKQDANTKKSLVGDPDGTLTWGGNNVLTSANYNNYALPLSGGTMTGTIIEEQATPSTRTAFRVRYSDIERGVAPSTTREGFALAIGDKNDDGIGGIYTVVGSGGSVTTRIYSTWAYNGTTVAKRLEFYNNANGTYSFYPSTDNDITLGASNSRWEQLYAGTATINTSDERLKDNIETIPDDVLDAWGEVNWYQYQFKDSIAEKGEKARLHTGAIAQRIESVFKSHGLDANRYGLLCYDEWEAEEEQKDEEGNVITEAREAGNRYSLRYEEALCMEAAYQRRRADRLEDRIEALEKLLMNRTE